MREEFTMMEAANLLSNIKKYFNEKYNASFLKVKEKLSSGKFILEVEVLNGKDFMPKIIITDPLNDNPSIDDKEHVGIYNFILNYETGIIDFYYDSPKAFVENFFNLRKYELDENDEPVFKDFNEFLRFNTIIKNWNESERGKDIMLCHFASKAKGNDNLKSGALINYFGIQYDFNSRDNASVNDCMQAIRKCLDYFGNTEFIEIVRELYSLQYIDNDFQHLERY